MEQDHVKGKTASWIGSIISILCIVLAAVIFYVAYKGSFERVFVLVAGGLVLLCLIGLFISYKGSAKMKKSGASNRIGKMGVIFSSLALITSFCIMGICATTKPADNIKLPEKEFNNEMDSTLQKLNESWKRDSLHADSVQRGLLKQ